MGIVKEELADVALSDDKNIRIEDNLNGKIHIHINDFRIELSNREFTQLREIILEGHEELEEYKDGI